MSHQPEESARTATGSTRWHGGRARPGPWECRERAIQRPSFPRSSRAPATFGIRARDRPVNARALFYSKKSSSLTIGGFVFTKIVITNVGTIKTGSGADSVVLNAGVKLSGDVSTGGGNDTVTLGGAAEIGGSLDGGTGSNTYVYTGADAGILAVADKQKMNL